MKSDYRKVKNESSREGMYKVNHPGTDISIDKFDEDFKKVMNRFELNDSKQNIPYKKNLLIPDILPKPLQDIVNKFHQSSRLPKNYYIASIITIAGALIGNSYRLKLKEGHFISPIVYTALIGSPSIGKTPVLKTCIEPLKNIEIEWDRQYKLDQKVYENNANSQDSSVPVNSKPHRKEILINEATVEAVIQAISNNPKGLLLIADELNGWLKSMNKYRPGNDKEFWLSNWSGVLVKVSRSTKATNFIENPSVSILGGIQHSILQEVAKSGSLEDGLLYRILFTFPDSERKTYFSEIEPSKLLFEEYEYIIRKLNSRTEYLINKTVSKRGYKGYQTITLSRKAKTIYIKWFNKNVDLINESESENIKSAFSKLDQYCLKFALILKILKDICEKGESFDNQFVDTVTMENAIALTEYYRKTIQYVVSSASLSSPMCRLPYKQESLYYALPNLVRTQKAFKIAEKMGFSRSTVHRLLRNSDLFEKINSGSYRKMK